VQETFHAAELFRILSSECCNFTENFSKEEFKVFRKRVIGLILATDMAKHVSDLSQLKRLLSDMGIKDGNNIDKLTNSEDEAHLFQNQQLVLENCLHSCDVSIPCRDFELVHDWTYLLFEEFFQQGDLEKEKGLPISMLCDRTTTNVAKSQPGFIGFVSMPLFTNLVHIMPAL